MMRAECEHHRKLSYQPVGILRAMAIVQMVALLMTGRSSRSQLATGQAARGKNR